MYHVHSFDLLSTEHHHRIRRVTRYGHHLAEVRRADEARHRAPTDDRDSPQPLQRSTGARIRRSSIARRARGRVVAAWSP
jgi:hypothetical protein